MSTVCDPRFLTGVRLFNEREFFACHDEWEEVWVETIGEDRQFYQGLIHAAVALHHFEEGNLTGARKMYESANRYLLPYAPLYADVDLNDFLAMMRDCFAPLLVRSGIYPTGATLDTDKIPRIRLDTEPARTEASS